MTEASIINLFRFEAVSCLLWYVPQFVSSLLYRIYRVTTHENYTALDLCEVRSVNFLKKINYLIKVCLEINMKQLTKVSSESDR